MIDIDERLPEDPLHAQVVLHVRRHLRRSIRLQTTGAVEDLALLFGLSPEESARLALNQALMKPEPLYSAAESIAAFKRLTSRIVEMGHDEQHIKQCWEWLRRRKANEPAFAKIIATDLHTLLVLSEALDLATASTPGGGRGSGLIPILIEGATGTGKEMLAQAIHAISSRNKLTREDRFEVVHVSGLTSDFVNDELFGHVKGGFTGAASDREGRLEAANGGSLLIDEVGDLSREAQVRLLRFLQDHTLSRTGENRVRTVDVRVIAATWHDLDREVKKRKFRLDLLHRLRVGRLKLPHLMDRANAFRDVVPAILADLGHKGKPAITRRATDALALHTWPGNLRELAGVLRVAEANAAGDIIRLEDLPNHLQGLYLRQPIEVRAPGLLCDEVEGKPPSPEQISTRVKRVAEELERVLPPDAAPPDLAVRNLLVSVPDSSPEHQAVIHKVDETIVRVTECKRVLRMFEAWKHIVQAGLPEPIEGPAVQKVTELQARVELAEAEVREAMASLDLAANPWWKLFADIAALPSFQGREPPMLRAGIIETLKIIHTIAPEIGERINRVVKIGGLAGVQKEAMRLLQEANEVESEERTPRKKYNEWTRGDWSQLVAGFGSKTLAIRETGISEKTITKYLKQHKIPETWGRMPPKLARRLKNSASDPSSKE